MEHPTLLQDLLHDRDGLRQEQVLAALRQLPTPRAEDRAARMQQYRLKAAELRATAEELVFYETKTSLLNLADSYEHTAAVMAHRRAEESASI